jgi:hypothetical protein
MLNKLRQAIRHASYVAGAVSTPAAAESVRRANELFARSGEVPDERALDELSNVLEAVQRLTINGYIEELRAGLTDKARFDGIIARLEKDKLIGKLDMDHIAHGVTQGREKWPSRKAALEAIKLRFVERAYQDAKLRNTEKAKVW